MNDDDWGIQFHTNKLSLNSIKWNSKTHKIHEISPISTLLMVELTSIEEKFSDISYTKKGSFFSRFSIVG